MIVSSSNCIVFITLSVADVDTERVDVFKLLVVYINQSMPQVGRSCKNHMQQSSLTHLLFKTVET